MIRHILIAAWRNMAANRLISPIAIGGLVIGLTAAILAGILTANQYSYDHFIPGSGQIYYAGLEERGSWTRDTDGPVTRVNSGTPLDLAKYLHQAIPESLSPGFRVTKSIYAMAMSRRAKHFIGPTPMSSSFSPCRSFMGAWIGRWPVPTASSFPAPSPRNISAVTML